MSLALVECVGLLAGVHQCRSSKHFRQELICPAAVVEWGMEMCREFWLVFIGQASSFVTSLQKEEYNFILVMLRNLS